MTRIHLSYQFTEDQIAATSAFMDGKPWREENNFTELANQWVAKMREAFTSAGDEVPPVNVVDAPGFVEGYMPVFDTPDGTTEARIVLTHKSMVSLFMYFAAHLAVNQLLREHFDPEEECRKWAYSLFYRTRPKMFRARVREGRLNLDPYAIYTSQTEQALRDYDIDPTDPRALTLLREAQEEALADTGDGMTMNNGHADEPVSETSGTQADDEIRAMNTRQLRTYATSQGLTGTWSMNKAQLLEALGVTVEVR